MSYVCAGCGYETHHSECEGGFYIKTSKENALKLRRKFEKIIESKNRTNKDTEEYIQKYGKEAFDKRLKQEMELLFPPPT